MCFSTAFFHKFSVEFVEFRKKCNDGIDFWTPIQPRKGASRKDKEGTELLLPDLDIDDFKAIVDIERSLPIFPKTFGQVEALGYAFYMNQFVVQFNEWLATIPEDQLVKVQNW